MGHRPSVNSGVNNSDNTSWKNPNENESTRDQVENNLESGSRNFLSPSPPTTPQPQREAWTARGQMLLNFHHAISRAINSPEMMRKCSQIAEDMPRSGEREVAPQQPTTSNKGASDSSEGRRRLTTSSDDRAPSAAASALESRSAAEEYGAEAALIVENKSKRDAAVRNKSVALGIFSFVVLRGGRGLSSLVRRSIANRRVAGSYQFEQHLRPVAMSVKSKTAESNTFESKQPSKLRRFFRVAIDVTLSTSATLLSGAFLFMPRPSAYIEDMAKLPLVEGKSVYAEVVCPPLLKEYRRVLEQYGGRWPVRGDAASGSEVEGDDKTPTSQLTQEDVSLNVIRTFVENCSKRSKYERALFEERNALSFDDDQSNSVSRLMRRLTRRTSAKSESIADKNLSKENNILGTISIPSPGVPENFPVDLDQDVYSLASDDYEEEGDESNGKQ